MQILLGAVLMMALLLCLGLTFYLGIKFGKRERKSQLDEIAKEKIKKEKEGFRNIMNYTVEQAMERRRVIE